jgi:nicotinamide-nucleotide amidase
VTTDDRASLAVAVHRELAERRATVAVAESLTGGLLGATLTAMPGASATFRGGVLAYATDLKETVLGVPGPLLAAQGAVSADVAAAMAGGVRDRLAATYGVALTGVAGPDPQDGAAPGTVFVAVAGPDAGQVRALSLPGGRDEVRDAAVRAALELLRDVVTGRSPG